MSLEKKIRNFLQGPRKGETFELKNGLVSQYRGERKDAIQRVIQAMTVGKDVSALFPDVLKNIATYDLEQKKLVYLYLMNYAKTHPELCILAVNTFVQDTEDPNPLIRALAIRTMGCIRVAKMVDYMEIPLSRTLKDDNPYVRKTAAICVAKLFDLNSEMCIEFGFLSELSKLIKDPNPMVVANALNALFEIKDMNTNPDLEIIEVNKGMVSNLLMCLNECTEWGRITILTTLNDYKAETSNEANHIIERIIPQLQHVNPSVVLSSIKAIINQLDSISVTAQRSSILKKLSAPLVSLVSSSIPEAQYVGLKNIRIILEKYPQILSKELRVFFIKYSDPLYLKLEKLEIMVRLANDSNSTLLLGELKEYAMEFESSLVAKAIRSIGTVAIKLTGCVIKSVNLICSLIDQRGGDLIINESIIVLTNILRRYPGKNDLITLIVPIISNHTSELSKNEALSGYIWLLGEYPKYFSQLKQNLSDLIDGFLDYESLLQLNILTTIVKINLSIENQTYSNYLQKVLEMATKDCENADVRDKAYIYWRLLSSSSKESQKKIVLSKLPPIKTTIASFNPVVLEALVKELSTLASVYHKPSFTFIDPNLYSPLSSDQVTTRRSKSSNKDENIEDLTNLAKQEIINNSKNENLLDFDDDEVKPDNSSSNGSASLLDELNDLFSAPSMPSQAQPTQPVQSSTNDILDLFKTSAPQSSQQNQNLTQGIDNLNIDNTSSSSSNQNKLNNDLLDLF
ncbi:DEHA2F17622p [Debaryomyces hansenii CBS767]|uniref:AP complex subunit beta n=1 Tax=Debaryomyces hansenii (strain ATCC 36239 / CBS 767 / BCRC 21394 / JCM 1990 / NBRC 0083 / IGC 2968) TaxID=284592 RepID=Q6BKZ5_DEBHA|nr:DEHA2F17622p [Debaryomyces hansenii CBS767]CAG89509.2 DEHA2F17622p [Debaryomyces hansenii CBS767]|eukprot:XP_461126.2 DEHA2F17622p [Debaryomyces hansenii CBS767]